MRERRPRSSRWAWSSQPAAGDDQTTGDVTSMIRRAAKDVDEAKARLAALVALRESMRRFRARDVGELPESVRAEHRGALRDPRWI